MLGNLGSVNTILTFPPGAVDVPVQVAIGVVDSPPATGGLKLAGKIFAITAQTVNGTAVTQFNLPYMFVIKYSDADVAGIDESQLALHYWSDAQQSWIAVTGTVDTANNTLTIVLDHLTVFALLERAAAHVYLPSLKR